MTVRERSSNSSRHSSIGAIAACLLGGVWLIVGAIVALNDGKWPIFMPPQLDLIAFPISLLSAKWGAYVGAAASMVIGVLMIGLGLFVATKGDHA